MGAEKGVGEGEVAFADEEDAVRGGKGDVWGVRFRAVCGLARWRLGFRGCRSCFGVWLMTGSFYLWPLCFAHFWGMRVFGYSSGDGAFRLRCQASHLWFAAVTQGASRSE